MVALFLRCVALVLTMCGAFDVFANGNTVEDP